MKPDVLSAARRLLRATLLLASLVPCATFAAPDGPVPPPPGEIAVTRIVTLAGQILTPDGKPAPNATASAYLPAPGGGWRVAASAPTDADGAFKLSLDPVPNSLVLAATAPGHALGVLEGLSLSANRAHVQLRLNEPATLRVPFLDPAGKPAANVPVRLRHLTIPAPDLHSSSFYFPHPDAGGPAPTVTDVDGIATFNDLPRDSKVYFRTDDPRYADLTLRDSVQLSTAPVTTAQPIRLHTPATIAGRVTFPDGKPVPSLRVGAQGVGANTLGYGAAITDADGRYRLERLLPGGYNVFIATNTSGNPLKDWTASAHAEINAPSGARLDRFDFQLIQGAVLSGRVLAEDDNRPVPDVSVWVRNAARPRSGSAMLAGRTAADGTYSILVPPGKQFLSVPLGAPPRGFLPLSKPIEHVFDVAEGQTIATDFKLARNPMKPVTGQVLDPHGNPLPDAFVHYLSPRPGSGRIATAKTDAQGRYQLFLNEPDPGILTASFQYWHSAKLIPARPGDQIEVRLLPDTLASMSGQVVDPQGQPIPDSIVQVTAVRREIGIGRGQHHAGPDGRFTLRDLPTDATYNVRASIPPGRFPAVRGVAAPVGHLTGIALQPGKQTQLPPLVIEPQ